MTPDPYAPYLRQADGLFAQGETVKAGQIWQAILKQQPSHAEARERLLAVKQRLLALRGIEAAAARPPAVDPAPAAPASDPAPLPAPPPPEPVRAATGTPEPERLVAEGCTLYDMGQMEDALRKWEQALALDPAHPLARGYADGARRELGLPPLQAPVAPAAVHAEDVSVDQDVDKLLREAVQLYDMGLVEEAIPKWERVLALEPQRSEVEGYLRQARSELENAAPSIPSAAPSPSAPPAPALSEGEALELKLRQADHLLTLQRHEEAAFTFQQALGLDPGNARALQGLERCRKHPSPGFQGSSSASRLGSGTNPGTTDPGSSPSPAIPVDALGRIAMAVEDFRPAEPEGVEPPAALLKATLPPREGLSVPERFRGTVDRLPWLRKPRLLAGVGGGLLALAAILGVVHGYRRDQALKEEVRAARAAAVAPVVQQAVAPDLLESPEAIRQEAEATLGTDPLRAYLRAETFMSRNAGDAAGAQLLEKARAGLAGGATGATLAEFKGRLQDGDLEAALKVMDALLRLQPGDGDLRLRAGRLHLALCSAHASQAKWDEAQEDLLRGRALFPEDKTWQARLKLLERVRTLPKNQQGGWLSLLG